MFIDEYADVGLEEKWELYRGYQDTRNLGESG
jgi:hypothetical protein